MTFRNASLAFGLLAAALGACSGSVSGGSGGPGGTGDTAGSGGDGGGGGSAGTGGPAASCTPAVGSAPLRRLSHAEYQATLEDLIPDLALARATLVKDPAQHGFENRALLLNPSPLLVEQYGTSAVDVGVKVAGKLSSVLPCTPTAATELDCGAQFIATFGARAFRRPLTADETATYTAFLTNERTVSGFTSAVQLTVEAMLQAPQFLYRLEIDGGTSQADRIKLTPYEIASRLSYLIWGSMPDAALFQAAAENRLDTPADREAQARRMMADPRAKRMLVEFHRQWLDFDRSTREAKDPKTYPSYNDALKSAIRDEADRFVETVMWSGDGTLGSFLTTTQAVVNAPLAALYQVTPPASGWGPVTLDPGQRAGFLTRANFLTGRAHLFEGSPPLRSVFILEHLFCQPPPVPPADANLSEPKASAGATPKTNRELFEARIAPATCNACHSQMDTIGYGLENYDAIGGYRTMDNGQPVNATGELKNVDVAGPFTGGVELSTKLAGSTEVRACAATNWFEFAIGREQDTADECRLGKLTQALTDAKGDVRELLIGLAKSPEFGYRPAAMP